MSIANILTLNNTQERWIEIDFEFYWITYNEIFKCNCLFDRFRALNLTVYLSRNKFSFVKYQTILTATTAVKRAANFRCLGKIKSKYTCRGNVWWWIRILRVRLRSSDIWDAFHCQCTRPSRRYRYIPSWLGRQFQEKLSLCRFKQETIHYCINNSMNRAILNSILGKWSLFRRQFCSHAWRR